MSLLAKTIVPEQFWVIVDESGKVGNIDRTEKGYTVKINGNQHYFSTRDDILKNLSIQMDTGANLKQKEIWIDFPVDGEIHNPIIDIKKRLYLYTKTEDSKCYYASGWFAMCEDNVWYTELSPKYIYLQRRKWMGPFYSKQQANDSIANLLNNQQWTQ